MKALHEAVFVFFLFMSGYFKKVNSLDDRKAWWNWKIIIKVALVIPLVEGLLVVIHHHDVHSSEQPGKKALMIWICLHHLSEY